MDQKLAFISKPGIIKERDYFWCIDTTGNLRYVSEDRSFARALHRLGYDAEIEIWKDSKDSFPYLEVLTDHFQRYLVLTISDGHNRDDSGRIAPVQFIVPTAMLLIDKEGVPSPQQATVYI